MKKQHTIINANDIHAALAGEHVEPLNLTPEEGKTKKAPKTRKTAPKKTTKKNIAAEVCKQLCFCFVVKTEEIYFKDVKTLKDLKAAHLALAKIHHPDNGGDASIMAAINAEYDQKVKELAKKAEPVKHRENKAEGMTDEEIACAIAEEFKATLDKLMKLDLDGVKVELIGSWLWISGNTKPIKEELKALGCRWCPKKTGQPWTWHDTYTIYISSKGRMSKADIVDKYGVEELKSA